MKMKADVLLDEQQDTKFENGQVLEARAQGSRRGGGGGSR